LKSGCDPHLPAEQQLDFVLLHLLVFAFLEFSSIGRVCVLSSTSDCRYRCPCFQELCCIIMSPTYSNGVGKFLSFDHFIFIAPLFCARPMISTTGERCRFADRCLLPNKRAPIPMSDNPAVRPASTNVSVYAANHGVCRRGASDPNKLSQSVDASHRAASASSKPVVRSLSSSDV